MKLLIYRLILVIIGGCGLALKNRYKISSFVPIGPSVFGYGPFGYFAMGEVLAQSYYLSQPVVSVITENILLGCDNAFTITMTSVADPSEPIFYEVEFWDLEGVTLINNFVQSSPVDYLYWDKSYNEGYVSGETGIFKLDFEVSNSVMDYIDANRVIKILVKAHTQHSLSSSSMYEARFSVLTPHAPEVMYGVVDEHNQELIFKWLSATDLPQRNHELDYKIEIYGGNASAFSMLSSLSAFSSLCGVNSASFMSMLSSLTHSGIMSAMYTSDWIAGGYSYTYWGLMSYMSFLSVGSYMARIGVWDKDASAMVWSLFEPFEIQYSVRYLTLQPGFNLYSIPIYDNDANTARKLVEIKGMNYLSEVIKWKELGSNNDKWESVAASNDTYQLTNDYDIEPNEGYFINLKGLEPITIEFRGSSWSTRV